MNNQLTVTAAATIGSGLYRMRLNIEGLRP